MEYTGNYWQPIAKVLYYTGLFVCVVKALLIYKYGNNSIWKGKTDNLDAVKIANYCLDRWGNLERYSLANQTRQILKTCRLKNYFLNFSFSLIIFLHRLFSKFIICINSKPTCLSKLIFFDISIFINKFFTVSHLS